MRRALSFCTSLWLCLSFLLFNSSPLFGGSKLVIADGGASGYLTKNSLPAVALAVAMEADLIKLNVVLSKDNQVIVFSESTLEQATNVDEIFPDRAREDGRYHVLDFTLDEIRQLSLHDPADLFPADLDPRLPIATLSEALALLGILETTMEKSIRIAVEIKYPWLYRKNGQDISGQALTILQRHGYGGEKDNIIILSYDTEELLHIAKELLPRMQMTIKLIQLIDSNGGSETIVEEWGELTSYNYDWMFSKSGLRSLKRYVAGVGLHKSMLSDDRGALLLPDFINNLHQLGMTAYTFPLQKEAQSMLPFVNSFEEELDFLYFSVGVDGIITDYCDDAVSFLKTRTRPLNPLPENHQPPVQAGRDPLLLTDPLPAFGTANKE